MYILGLHCDPHDALVETILLLNLVIHEIRPGNNISILDPVVMHSPYAPVAKSFLCSFFYRAWRVPSEFPIFSSHSSLCPDILHHWDQ